MRPKKVILVVDDNEQVLSLRKFLLETWGYRVIQTLSAVDALQIIALSVPGTLDLLLTDLLMPAMDGNELVRQAKLLHPSLPCMIVSGTVSDPTRVVADGFALKGSRPEDLLTRVKILVARKRGPKKAVVTV